jgi:hypothetical protein
MNEYPVYPVDMASGVAGVLARVLGRRTAEKRQREESARELKGKIALEQKKTLYDTWSNVVKSEAERRGRADTERVKGLNEERLYRLKQDPNVNKELEMNIGKTDAEKKHWDASDRLAGERNVLLGEQNKTLAARFDPNSAEGVARRQHLVAQASALNAQADLARGRLNKLKSGGVDLKTVDQMKSDLLQYRSQLIDLLKYDDDSLEDIFGEGFTVANIGDKIKAVDSQMENLNGLQGTMAGVSAPGSAAGGGGVAAAPGEDLGADLRARIDMNRTGGGGATASSDSGGGEMPISSLFKYKGPELAPQSMSMEEMYKNIMGGAK